MVQGRGVGRAWVVAVLSLLVLPAVAPQLGMEVAPDASAAAGVFPTGATLEPGRFGPAAVWDARDRPPACGGGCAYVFGGADGSRYFDEIVRYNPAKGAVDVVEHLPSPRYYPAAVWTGTEAYVFGGFDPAKGRLREIVRYDPDTGVRPMNAQLVQPTEGLSAVWDPRDRPAAGCPGGCAYLFAGGDGGDRRDNAIYQYNPSNDRLDPKGALFTSGRSYTSAVWDPRPTEDCPGGCAYVFGGQNSPGGTTAEIVRYIPDTNTANVVASLPGGRRLTSASWQDDHALIFGGSSSGTTWLNEVVIYIPGGVASQLPERLPTARCCGAAVGLGGDEAIVFGGFDHAAVREILFAGDSCKLDQDGDGLWDCWETGGIDIDGDGVMDLDLPAMGADPRHKDVFVEVDYMHDYLVQALYVLPKDGVDEGYATDGRIANSINAFQAWLRDQTGGRTVHFASSASDGAPQVRVVRLDKTEAEISAQGDNQVDALIEELKSLGFPSQGVIYAVWYGGSSAHCGQAPVPGLAAALYLKGRANCNFRNLGSSETDMSYAEFAMIHEILHAIGMVPSCAKHHTKNGHVSDDPFDIMYAGDKTWGPLRTPADAILDSGRDDYFRHGKADCPDLAWSPWFSSVGGHDGVLPALASHHHRPSPPAVAEVVNAFAAAPIGNPDGKPGINLHVLIDEAIPEQATTDFSGTASGSFFALKRGNPNHPCTGYFGLSEHKQDPVRCEAVLKAWSQVAFYAMFAHAQPGTTSSGIAELCAPACGSPGSVIVGGNDFLVTLGEWSAETIRRVRGQAAAEESALMHEFGHALGLGHGGFEHQNCKPNYLSVMNYNLNFGHLDSWRLLDYSSRKLPALDERSLDEAQGVGNDFLGFPFTFFTDPAGRVRKDGSTGGVDWNWDGDRDDADLSVDLNRMVLQPGGGEGVCWSGGLQVLEGHNDWLGLDLNFRDSCNFDDRRATALGCSGTSPGPSSTDSFDLTAEEVDFMAAGVDYDDDGLSNADDPCPGNAEDGLGGAPDDGCPDATFTTATAIPSGTVAGAWSADAWTVTLDSCATCVAEHQVDRGELNVYARPVAIDREGLHEFTYQAITRADRLQEPLRTLALGVDRTAPATALGASASQSSDGVWTAGSWTVTATCDDPLAGAPAGASGCAGTRADVDGAQVEVLGSLTLDAEGLHDLAVWSEDLVGNTEAPWRGQFGVDRTGPATQALGEATGPVADHWTSGEWRVALACADPLAGAPAGASGCARTELALEDTELFLGDAWVFAGEGVHVLGHRGVDRVGNEGPWAQDRFGVDRTPPSSRMLGGDLGAADGTVFVPPLAPVRLRASAEDMAGEVAGSGVAAVCFQVEAVVGKAPVDCVPAAQGADGAWEVRPDLGTGVYEIRAVASDRVGNAAASEPQVVVVAFAPIA